MSLAAIEFTAVNALGHDAVPGYEPHHLMGMSALAEVALAMQHMVAEVAVQVVVVYQEHFGEVVSAFAPADELRLEEGDARMTPAGAGTALVFGRCGGVVSHRRQDVGDVFLRKGSSAQEHCCHNRQDAFHRGFT